MNRPYQAQPMVVIDKGRDVSGNHYWVYHDLQNLLRCKRPMTLSKDEDMFITVHQMCELSFHQMIIDLGRALDAFRAILAVPVAPLEETADLVYFLARTIQLYERVIHIAPTLKDLRGFAEFRTSIGPSSGFQSFQFRQLEIMTGVGTNYWQGATENGRGELHPAELQFNITFGEDLKECFQTYAKHNLATYFVALCSGTGETAREQQVQALKNDEVTNRILGLLDDFQKVQLRFHRTHLDLAVTQLNMVRVDEGTGGTEFQDYLGKYERDIHPLFPMT